MCIGLCKSQTYTCCTYSKCWHSENREAPVLEAECREQERGVGSTKLLRSNHLIFSRPLHVRYTLSPYQVKSRQLLSNDCYVMVCGVVVHMHIHPAKAQDKCVYSQTVCQLHSFPSGKEQYENLSCTNINQRTSISTSPHLQSNYHDLRCTNHSELYYSYNHNHIIP